MLSKKDEVAFEDLMWRVKNDPWARSQFEPLEDEGYMCESGAHEDRPAEYRRPPMPEKKSPRPIYFCADCWRGLPA